MAQLLLIKTAKTDIKMEDDIVGIFPDSWTFSQTEHDIFNIVSVPGDYKILLQLMPIIKTITKASTLEWTTVTLDEKEIWYDPVDGIYKDLVKRWKHRLCYKNGKIQITFGRSAVNQVDAGTIEGLATK